MSNAKHGLPRKERMAQLRGQVTDLLWYGKIETTPAKAKSVSAEAEKLLTLAVKSYKDTVKVVKTIDENGVKVEKEFINDGEKNFVQEEK